jgi:NodT family efflux transporter outer membrane factor (OMF) lipoprotein
MTRRFFLCAISTVASTVLLLQACSLVPAYSPYTRPHAGLPETMPARWRENPAAPSHDAVINAAWWRKFGSVALPRLQEAGLARNHDFAASGWKLTQAVAQSRAARAPLFPWLGAEGQASRKGAHGSGGFSMSDAVSGGFQASYELDVWGRIRSQADSAAFMAEASLNDWRAAGLALESDMALAYFYLLAQQERLAVQREILNAAAQMLEYMEKRQRAGAAMPLDIVRQKSDVAALEAGVQGLERQAQAAENSLNSLLGNAVTPEELKRLMNAETLTQLFPPTVPAGLPSDLLTRRPDILKAEAALKSANADIETARAAFLPMLKLTVQGGWQSDELHSLFRPSSALYALIASLTAPVFQGGRLEAQYDTAIARQEEMLARYQQTALSGFLETDTAIAANGFLAQEAAKRTEAVREAQEAFQIVRVLYREGAAESLAVLDAQRTLLNTRDAQVAVTLARLNASVSLFKALGGGWGEQTPSTR